MKGRDEMDDDLRIRVAEAIGKSLAEFTAHKWDGLAAEPDSIQGALIAAAGAAIAERERSVPNPPLISDEELRDVMAYHAGVVDIIWGSCGRINGVAFVEDATLIDIRDSDMMAVPGRKFTAGTVYWTGDGSHATPDGWLTYPCGDPYDVTAVSHHLPVPDAA
jgi:hypothetical protein